MKAIEVITVHIPHQMPVTVGYHKNDRAEAENDINHESWEFWNDSNLTIGFDTPEEMIEWAENYRGHKSSETKLEVRKFIRIYFPEIYEKYY